MKPIKVSVRVNRPRAGRRRTRGTYTLEELPDGVTDVGFELVVLAAPPAERLLGPFLGLWLRRVNAKALARLAAGMSELPQAPGPGRRSGCRLARGEEPSALAG